MNKVHLLGVISLVDIGRECYLPLFTTLQWMVAGRYGDVHYDTMTLCSSQDDLYHGATHQGLFSIIVYSGYKFNDGAFVLLFGGSTVDHHCLRADPV